MKRLNNGLINDRDLSFILYEWLDIETLLGKPEFADMSRDTFEAIAEMSNRLAQKEFLTHYKEADTYELSLADDGVRVLPAAAAALRKYADSGLFSAGFPSELGGLGLPHVVCSAAFAYFAAANISTIAYALLTVANARLIVAFGTNEQVKTFAVPQIAGRWFGTMCLSEPQAGSGLADIRMRAQLLGEDSFGSRYHLTGNKMWISGGDQDISENIVHLVLAKIPAHDGNLPRGTEGISLFIVPKIRPDGSPNGITVTGLNHKMGYRGISNCLLTFGEKDEAIGWLIGEPSQGLKQMFVMMNEARTGIGLGAAALGYRGYLLSLGYSRERLQGRRPGVRDGAPVAIIEHPDVKRMLLTQKVYVEGALALCLLCAKLLDEKNADSEALLGLLTPVAKTWPSEYGLAANDIAIQIHGGYGYTQDFDLEQLYRDNRLNSIHEGTTGIQAIDLLNRKILRDDAPGLRVLKSRIFETIVAVREFSDLRRRSMSLDDSWVRLEESVAMLKTQSSADVLQYATPFLWALGHIVVGWIWLDQALTARHARVQQSEMFYEGKRHACRFYFEYELPKVAAWLAPVAAMGGVIGAVSPGHL